MIKKEFKIFFQKKLLNKNKNNLVHGTKEPILGAKRLSLYLLKGVI